MSSGAIVLAKATSAAWAAGFGRVEDEIERSGGRRFGDLKAAADQHTLQTIGSAVGIAEQQNAVTNQIRQEVVFRARGGGKL